MKADVYMQSIYTERAAPTPLRTAQQESRGSICPYTTSAARH